MFTRFLLLAFELPKSGENAPYERPPSATSPTYIEVLENNSHIIYPAIAALVLVLIAVGILQAWKTDDLSGVKKAEIKRDLVRELRRDVYGRGADELAKLVGMPPNRVLLLLEEMREDGVLESQTDSGRRTKYRLKGLM